jgi:DnaJ homolog subfamily C member 1
MNFAILFCVLTKILAWSPLDITIFDLQQSLRSHFGSSSNFYTTLQVDRQASDKEIIKAYRKVSLLYHPDKNPDENAKEIYKLLTSIQSLLKDSKSRKVYDKHLLKGFPTFRAGGYFYEKWEPGLVSSLLFVMGVVSIAQYVTNWIFYYQARSKARVEQGEVKEVPFKTKAQRKKEEKKGIVEVQDQEQVQEELKVPSVLDVVIFKIPMVVVDWIRGLAGNKITMEKVNKQE